MKKTGLKKASQKAIKFASKQSPKILTGLGIAGMVTTAVLVGKATLKADLLRQEEIERRNKDLLEEAKINGYEECAQITKLAPVEIVKTCWKCYAPAVLLGMVSSACLIGANSVSTRRTAALATAYKLSENALSDYREKVIETIGEKEEKEIKSKVNEKKVSENPATKSNIIITNKGNTLCYECLSGRYFTSDIDSIKKVINELNKNLLKNDYISLNDFYLSIGLDTTTLGNLLGWSSEKGLIEVDFDAKLNDKGQPYIIVDFNIPPKYDYSVFA